MENKFIIRNNKRADSYNLNNKIINGVPIMNAHNYKPIVWISNRLEQQRGNIPTNGGRNNNDNTTTPMFTGVSKTTQKAPQQKMFSIQCIVMDLLKALLSNGSINTQQPNS
jgi:hypothetical protein